MKNKRTGIPSDVQLKLWVKSGGYCEFPGCTDFLLKDKLTLKEDNYSNIAHIIADSPNGRRGDISLSSKLATDFSNLMLLCQKHHKLIDGKNWKDYSVDILRSYKEMHENCVKTQLSKPKDLTTTIIRFVANIGDRHVEISLPQIYNAIDSRYPDDDKGIFLDYTSRPGRGDKAHWKSFSNNISNDIKQHIIVGNNQKRIQHISLFALAPIPLLISLGKNLGNIIPVDLYQKHRDTDNWTWKPEKKDKKLKYIIKKPKIKEDVADIILVLSLSGAINKLDVVKILPNQPLYEISLSKPDRDFLSCKSRLEDFKLTYRKLLTEIKKNHGSIKNLHIFPAIPAPIAVACGMELLPKIDPNIIIYDYDSQKKGFIKILSIK
jgi:hypothetical protein